MQRMEQSIAVNNVLCVHFRPKISSDPYYITIRNGNGCSSYVKKNLFFIFNTKQLFLFKIGQNPNMNGERTVSLQAFGCLDHGRITHELLHTLGNYSIINKYYSTSSFFFFV